MNRLGWVLLVIVLLVSTAGVQASGDYRASRIELKDGKVFSNVFYSIDATYKVLRIDLGGSRQAVNFGDVSLILDESGNDVSRDVLGEYYSPLKASEQSTAPANSRVTTSRTDNYWTNRPPKSFGVRIALHPNFSIPAGDYYDGIGAGIGFGGDMSIRLADELALRAMVSYAGLKPDDMTGEPVYDMYVVEDNSKLSVWRYSINVEYYNWPDYGRGGNLLWYVYSGVGAISHKASGSVVFYYPYDGNYYVGKISGSITKFMMDSGGGITLALSPVIGVNFGADMYMAFVGEGGGDYYSSVQTAYNFDLKAGIVLFLR